MPNEPASSDQQTQTTPEAEAEAEAAESQNVTLTASQYNALLDRIDELEDTPASRTSAAGDDIDNLLDEGTTTRTPNATPPKDVNLDNLTNTQMVEYMFQAMDATLLPLAQQIKEQGIVIEIDQMMRETNDDGKPTYDDFFEYEDAIKKAAIANPQLSMRECYALAKGTSPKPAPKTTPATPEAKKERKDNLRGS